MSSAWATLPATDIAVATISQHQKKRAAARRASTTSEPITTSLTSPWASALQPSLWALRNCFRHQIFGRQPSPGGRWLNSSSCRSTTLAATVKPSRRTAAVCSRVPVVDPPCTVRAGAARQPPRHRLHRRHPHRPRPQRRAALRHPRPTPSTTGRPPTTKPADARHNGSTTTRPDRIALRHRRGWHPTAITDHRNPSGDKPCPLGESRSSAGNGGTNANGETHPMRKPVQHLRRPTNVSPLTNGAPHVAQCGEEPPRSLATYGVGDCGFNGVSGLTR